MGRQVQRVSTPADEGLAETMLAEAREGSIVVQPFLAGFADGDTRIITVRGPDGAPRPIAWLTRIPAPGEWICNLSRGGTCVIRDPDRAQLDLAVEVAARSGLDCTQLDFGRHEGRLYLIEINQAGGGYIDFDIGDRANCGDAVAQFVEALARDHRG